MIIQIGPDDPRLSAAPSREAALRALFLARLGRLARLAAEPEASSPTTVRLLRLCLFSTYLDCRALGARAEARAVLERGGGS